MEGLAGERKGNEVMEMIRVKLLRSNAKLPSFGSQEAAGADLYACLEEPVTILPGQTAFLPTGLAMEIPQGYAGLIYARSGLACKKGLAPANKVGVVDSDYRGEFIVALYNHSDAPRTVVNGERIAQLVVTPVLRPVFVQTQELSETQRAEGGFGSTGV